MLKDQLDRELIELFIDRLFQEYHYSVFEFEKAIMDFICDGKSPFKNDDCDNCFAIDELENDNEYLEKEKKVLQSKLKDATIRVEGLKKEMETLRKNSVLFTMEDIQKGES
jgi:hypothetical protein